MKSTLAVLATTLVFPLMLFAQRGSSASSSGGGSSNSSASSVSSSSSSSSSHSSGGSSGSSSSSSNSSSSSSRASSGSSGSRGSGSSNSASSTGSRASATERSGNEARNSGSSQGKSSMVQSKDNSVKGKPSPGTAEAREDHVKRSWLPWKWHSPKPVKNNEEDKKPKCKPGKPCKGEEQVAQNEDIKPVCKPGKPCVCPPGTSLNGKGMCVSTPPATTYNNCTGASPNINSPQTAGRPCALNPAQNNCSGLALEIQREEMELQRTQVARESACAQDPGGQQCVDLTAKYEREALSLEQMKRDYAACLHH